MISSGLDLVSELQNMVPEEFRMGIQEIVNNQKLLTNAEMILQLCRIITRQIDIYTANIQAYGKQLTIYRGKTNVSQEKENELMVYGAQLIYLLRSFIWNEDIMFHMGTTDSYNRYKADAFIPQSQILPSLTVTKQNAVGVSVALQKELIAKNRGNNLLQVKRENLWRRVEQLSEARYLSGRNISKVDLRKAGAKKAHWAYQSQKKDMLIYLKFSGNQVSKYYDMSGSGKRDSLQHFNNGWLWEWYNSILYGGTDEQYAEATKAIKAGSLKPIMQTPDYIAGTKQGDFRDALGRQVQSKYNNEKIISFNNIRHIVYKLEKSLAAFIQEGQDVNVQNNLMSVLQEHFFPESINLGDKFGKQVAEEILGKFNSNITAKKVLQI